jgi:hypothetical protein
VRRWTIRAESTRASWQIPATTKRVNVADSADESRGGQHADTRNRLEASRHRMRDGEPGQLAIEIRDSLLESMDFIHDERDRLPQDLGNGAVRILENRGHAPEHRPSAHRNRVTLFSQESAHGVDLSNACRLHWVRT